MMILAVFRVRAQSLDYAERLGRYGITAITMPTPKEAKIGCGLCVRFDGRYYPRANALLKTANYSSFKGFYKMDFALGRVTVTRYP